MHGQGVLGATLSPIATGLSVAVHALDMRVTAPPGHVPPWCRARPAHTARLVGVAHREIVCGGLIHHRLSPSYGAPACPTRRASPSTALGAFDSCNSLRTSGTLLKNIAFFSSDYLRTSPPACSH